MRATFSALLFLFGASSLLAQVDLKPQPVTATLLSEQSTIAAGKAFRVAVKLEHQPTFHTYGKALPPGVETGIPTSIQWKLPQGWKADDLPWPATHETESTGGTKVQGYSGTVYLPAKLTPPAELAIGSTVKLEATIKGLVCDPQSCMPITLPVSVELKVGEKPESNPAASDAFKPFKTTLVSELSTVAAAKSFRIGARIELDPGWHTYGKAVPEGVAAKPTKVSWKLPEGWKMEELAWPPTKEFKSADGKMAPGYERTVILPVKVTPPAHLPANGSVEVEATLDMIVCKDVCIPAIGQSLSITLPLGSAVVRDDAVAKSFDLPVAQSVSAGAPAARRDGVASLLLFAFIGGLILNVMPCVFPVLAIKILGFVNQAGQDKRRVFHHGLAYTGGVMVSMLVLGALVVTVGLSWGGQLQSPVAVLILAGFFLVFGLNMAGVFEIGTSAIGVGSELQARSGLQGSFFSGLLATVVATPCAAPFLSVALAATLTLPAIQSMLIFAFIGLGLSAPYLLLSIFPKLVRVLPRPGAWMETFKQAMSFLLFATVAFLVWVLTAMVDEYGLLRALFGLVMVAAACWIYGRWSSPVKTRTTRITAMILSLFFLASGMALGWPKKPTMNGNASESELAWEKWSPESVQSLRAEKKPVYIDFTARWCATCQTNKLVYLSKEIQDDFKTRGVVTLKADFTNFDERIKAALTKLDRAAVPVNVLYVPGREDPVILPNILTVDNVKAALGELDKT